MGFTSAKKSSTSKNPSYELCADLNLNFYDVDYDEEFEKGGLVFPSYNLYCVLADINEILSSFYTKTGEERDYEPIFDSETRHCCNFENNCQTIKYFISLFKDIKKKDSRVSEFLYNYRLSSKFSSLFDSICNVFMEAMQRRNNFDNEIKRKQNNEIKKIVKDLAYHGIDPFSPHMI